MEHLSLLAGGQEHTVADWEREAAAVLRKAGTLAEGDPDSAVWERLGRATLDGITLTPLGTPELLEGLPDPGAPGAAPYMRGIRATPGEHGWDIRSHLAEPDPRLAAEAALADLENGATSLWLVVGDRGLALADLATALAGVHLDRAPVVLMCDEDPTGAAIAFTDLLSARGLRAAPGTNLGGDPVGAGLRGGAGRDDPAAIVGRLAGLAQEHGTRALVVDATAAHDAGASDAQELGYGLALGAAYLRMLTGPGTGPGPGAGTGTGGDVATAASLLEFRYAATVEQFPTIAKLRAARRLWHRVLELSGAADVGGQVQHAVTSRPSMTKHDPWVNMLRGTVAAFAAGVGGATSVTVLPFDCAIGLADGFSRRIARNTSSLLVHEAHVARVVDPAGGAYAVERLTDDLARAAWAEFARIEEEGGVVASLRSATGVRDRVSRTAGQRGQQVARRSRAVTGVSEFPNLNELLPVRRPFPTHAWEREVPRYSGPFEQLRDRPAPPPVFLATMGPVAAHTPRATFAANLLASGGIDSVAAGATASAAEVLASYAGQPVVCLCGTDLAYAEWGPEVAHGLKRAGARWVVVAGRPTGELADQTDDSAAVGLDALVFLDRVVEQLGEVVP